MAECEWLPFIEFCINLAAGKMPLAQADRVYLHSINLSGKIEISILMSMSWSSLRLSLFTLPMKFIKGSQL